MTRRIIPLIMCGGAGTRLWPASREVRPKQFLPLFGTRSTFQETLLRVSDAALFERPIIITNAAYRFMVLEQLAEIGIEADVLLGADAAGLRSCDRGRRGFRRVPRQGGRRAGARGRSRRARHGSLSRRLPRGTGGCGERAYRDLRRHARTCRDRIWLYQSRRGGVRPGSRGCQIRREAGSADRRAICESRLSLEQRQLHVPRRRSARRIRQVRCGERADGLGVRHQGRARSRLRHARPRRLSPRRSRFRSTMQ